MADYWKSQPRKFCDFCKCWIADNKPSRDFHERGKRHQENVAKKISEVRKKGMEQARNEKDVDGWMVQMEREALKKLREDITADPSLASQYGVTIKSRSVEAEVKQEKTGAMGKTVDGSADGSSDWQEELSSEGYVYYWNTKTGESRWEVPEDSPQSKDAQKADRNGSRADGKGDRDSTVNEGKSGTVHQSDCQQRTDGATVWQQLQSADGYPYYWNTQTGEVSWEVPSSTAADVIQTKDEELTPAAADDDDEEEERPCIPKEESGRETTERKSPSSDPAATEMETRSPPPESPAIQEEEEEEVEPVRKRPRDSVYGEWQELKDESEPLVDLQLPPVDHNTIEVRTIVLAAEPKIKFKEKTIESLGIRSTGSKPVEFKKRRLNSGAVKGNIRRTDFDQDT